MLRGSGAVSTQPPSITLLPMLVMSGESNSGSQAVNDPATAAELSERTRAKILNNNTLLFENLHVGVNNLIGHSGISGAKHSWELGFGNMAEAGQFQRNPIYIVKTGQGGTRITDWAVGATYSGTNCWQVFQDRVDSAITNLSITASAKFALLYTQGLNDWLTPASWNADTWKTATIAHFAKIRAKYGNVPIVMTKFMSYYSVLNQCVIDVAASVSNCYTVETSDLSLIDTNHWDYAAQKVIAQRMVDTLIANGYSI